MTTTVPTLIPCAQPPGSFDIWNGNDLAGEAWPDRERWRWAATWRPGEPFRTGHVDTLAEAIAKIINR